MKKIMIHLIIVLSLCCPSINLGKIVTNEVLSDEHYKIETKLHNIINAFQNQGIEKALNLANKKDFHVKDNKIKVVAEFDNSVPTYDEIKIFSIEKDRVFDVYENKIQMMIPIEKVIEFSNLANLVWIRLPNTAYPCIISEGVNIIEVDNYEYFGVSGKGIKVAVIDGGFFGFENLCGNELPSQVVTRSYYDDVTGNGDITGDNNNHGTACAEIIHDIAPDAELYLINFHSGHEFDLATQFAIQQGVDIISCSMIWYAVSNYDGSGPACDVTRKATSQDILWVNGMGNHAKRHYEGAFKDLDGDDWHEFPGNDEDLDIRTNGDKKIEIYLSWNDWPKSSNDYAMFLYDNNYNIVDYSNNHQDGTIGPVESINYEVNKQGVYHLKIKKGAADGNAIFKLFSSGYNATLEYFTAYGSILDPAPAESVLAVGATYWQNDQLADYSSQGPTNDGRIKPDISAPTGVSTKSQSTFHGTSASTPHVAGAAALLLSQNNYLNINQINSYLENSAKPLGSPGKNNQFGSGRLSLKSIRVNAPNGGESLFSRQNYPIRWETKGSDVASVKIQYSTDSRQNWITIPATILNAGFFNWYVPQINSSTCRIRIIAQNGANQGLAEDISDNDFIIETSKPSHLSCSAIPSSLNANGISTSNITAQVFDQNGNLVTDATNEITFSITSGSASGQLIGTNPVNAVNGIATITLQSTTTPGIVTIEATSPGLTSGSTIVNVYNNPTAVGGHISQDTTWPLSGSPYVVTSDLTIDAGVILTIEPGVTVKFNRERDIFIYGALKANGTASAPITFTANADNPYTRYWGGIKFYNSNLDTASILNYCTISYGGQGGYGNLDTPLNLNGFANPTITNTTMIHNNRNGIDLEATTYASDINLNITALPYILRDNLRMSSGATCTIRPGVLMKCEGGSDLFIYGGLKAVGTPTQHIIFTSIRDDSRGGDTNGDGITAGTPGDWGGISFDHTTMDANSILEYCEIYFAGQGGYGNNDCPLALHPMANPTIKNVYIANNRLNGIDLWTGSYSSDILLNITDLPYIIRGDFRMNEGASLTINPGVLLKFSGESDFFIYGGLMAPGAASSHIIFTSLRDDSHGGDTNGDGATAGNPGEWGGIWFDSKVNDTKCLMDYCDIMYAGQGGYGNLESPLALNALANPTFTNISLTNNTRNGIDVGTGHYYSDIFFNTVDIPYMIRGDIVVEASATLTIDPGVIIKFGGGCDFFIKGALIASGNDNNHIIFTSLQDDSHGGDTNGDGPTVGSKGNWGGIYFYDSIIDKNSILNYCEITYAGCGGYGNNDSPIALNGLANPTITNCILQDNTRNAINLSTGHYSSDFYLDVLNFPYMVRGDIIVDSPAKLTIHPGVVLKFDGGSDLWIDGSLIATGTPDNLIKFTL